MYYILTSPYDSLERGPWSGDPGHEAINMTDPMIPKCAEDMALKVCGQVCGWDLHVRLD